MVNTHRILGEITIVHRVHEHWWPLQPGSRVLIELIAFFRKSLHFGVRNQSQMEILKLLLMFFL